MVTLKLLLNRRGPCVPSRLDVVVITTMVLSLHHARREDPKRGRRLDLSLNRRPDQSHVQSRDRNRELRDRNRVPNHALSQDRRRGPNPDRNPGQNLVQNLDQSLDLNPGQSLDPNLAGQSRVQSPGRNRLRDPNRRRNARNQGAKSQDLLHLLSVNAKAMRLRVRREIQTSAE